MDMKQFKKAAAVLAVFSLLVGNLTGCANGQTQEAATSTPEQVAAEVTKVVGDGGVLLQRLQRQVQRGHGASRRHRHL
jgi:hypothetical protein